MSTSLAEYRICAVVTVLVYMLNARSGIAVGTARDKFGVPMPKTIGPVAFERAFRTHANNAEQYPQFLFLMWVFAVFVNATVGGILGVVWVVLRHCYVTRYHATGEKAKVTVFTIPAYMILSFYSVGILFTVLRGAVVDYL